MGEEKTSWTLGSHSRWSKCLLFLEISDSQALTNKTFLCHWRTSRSEILLQHAKKVDRDSHSSRILLLAPSCLSRHKSTSLLSHWGGIICFSLPQCDFSSSYTHLAVTLYSTMFPKMWYEEHWYKKVTLGRTRTNLLIVMHLFLQIPSL